MTPQAYLERAALSCELDQIAIGQARQHFMQQPPLLPLDSSARYCYRVPQLGENGACSLPDQLADEPYDLRPVLGGANALLDKQLATLDAMLAEFVAQTGAGWVGVYQTRQVEAGLALVKLAYLGKPSRAEFPLTPAFAQHSNNSAVGLSGKARVIDDVAAWTQAGEAYYNCDGVVRSEACLPLFDQVGNIVGIVDAEDSRVGFFAAARLEVLAGLCLAVVEQLPAR